MGRVPQKGSALEAQPEVEGSEESLLWLGTGQDIREAGKAPIHPTATSPLPPPLEPHQATESPGTCHILSHLQALAPDIPAALNALSSTSRPPSRLCTNIALSKDHLAAWQPPASLGPVPAPSTPICQSFCAMVFLRCQPSFLNCGLPDSKGQVCLLPRVKHVC